jgi:uncharacterized membrane protein
MNQNRFKSYPLWVAIGSLVALVLKDWFGVEIPSYDEFVNSVLGILIMVGVLNNPTDKTNW